jgi:hypothetical protein
MIDIAEVEGRNVVGIQLKDGAGALSNGSRTPLYCPVSPFV